MSTPSAVNPNEEEASRVCTNLKGEADAIARYVMGRCASMVYDCEREVFIAAFLRAQAKAHTEALQRIFTAVDPAASDGEYTGEQMVEQTLAMIRIAWARHEP